MGGGGGHRCDFGGGADIERSVRDEVEQRLEGVELHVRGECVDSVGCVWRECVEIAWRVCDECVEIVWRQCDGGQQLSR